MKRLALFALAMILVGVSAYAQKSASTSAAATTTVIRSLSIDKNQDLDFGRVAQGVTETIAWTSSKAVKFTVLGEDLENVNITFAAPSVLTHTNGTATLPLTSYVKQNASDDAAAAWEIASGATVGLNATGNYYVYLGGQVSPAANQTRGFYSGDFTINVEY
jgi:hypothetical protein